MQTFKRVEKNNSYPSGATSYSEMGRRKDAKTLSALSAPSSLIDCFDDRSFNPVALGIWPKHNPVAKPEKRLQIIGQILLEEGKQKTPPPAITAPSPTTTTELLQTAATKNLPTGYIVPPLLSCSSQFAEIALQVRNNGYVSLDLETFGEKRGGGLDPWRGNIRLLTLSVREQVWIIDLQKTGYDLGELGDAIESVNVVAHNAKFDLLWLAVKCNVRPQRVTCSMTLSRILGAGIQRGNGLDDSLERYLSIPAASDYSTSDWGGLFITNEQLRYAARDVVHLDALVAKMNVELGDAGLQRIVDLELALLPIVVAMEEMGIAIDTSKLKAIDEISQQHIRELGGQLRQLLKRPALNLSSPPQLLDAFQSIGINVAGTAEEALEAANDGLIIPLVIKLRGAEKISQQAKKLLKAAAADGRIHGRFEPLGTQTGRFSSKEPNLQNIARGEMRECFMAPEGKMLIVADYSQIELRVAAALTGEKKMIDAYKQGDDLHMLTAATILGKSPQDVTGDDRQLAKAVNFGLLFGQNAEGLMRYAKNAFKVDLTLKEARNYRAKFFHTYAGLASWHERCRTLADKWSHKETRTRLGRRRMLESARRENWWTRFSATVNTPVQGSCADGLKMTMLTLASSLPAEARIVSTVHDELIVEADAQIADTVAKLLQDTMVGVMQELFPEVPIEAEVKVCRTWAEKN